MKRIGTMILTCILAMSTMAVQTGCTAAQKLNVVNDIEKLLPAVTNVADAVCGLAPTSPICSGGITAFSGSATVLVAALQSYFAAEAAGTVPPTVLQSLALAITTFEGNAQNILNSIHVLNPALQGEVEAIAAAASVLLAVIEALLPATTAAAQYRFTASKPAAFSLPAFVSDYNGKVDACSKWMPRNVKLKKIHVHSLALRVLTLGGLK